MSRTTGRVSAEQAEHNADALVRFRAAGQVSLDRCPADEFTYEQAAERLQREMARRSAEPGTGLPVTLNLDTIAKMRRVAEQYTAAQIADLADRVRRHRSRFSTTHLIRLLGVNDRETRDALEKQAVRKSWSLAVLVRHAQAVRGGRRAGAGRRPAVPADSQHQLLTLEGLCLRWARWTSLAKNSLPRSVRPLINVADEAVNAVRTGVATHLTKLAKAAEKAKSVASGRAANVPDDRRPRKRSGRRD